MSNVRRQRVAKGEPVRQRAVLRPRRQVTLSRAVCEALGVQSGDELSLEVADGILTVKPGTKAALEAIAEFRKAIAESGVTLEELLATGRQVRDEIAHEMYPDLFPEPGETRRRRRSA